MTEPRDPEGTSDREPPGDPLDAGLAVAFGPDPAAPTGPHQRATAITADLSAWYAGSGVLVMLVLAGLAVYGFSISLAGRPLLRDLFFQDE